MDKNPHLASLFERHEKLNLNLSVIYPIFIFAMIMYDIRI